MTKAKIFRLIRAPFVILAVNLIYLWGCLWYDKRYLTGKYFSRTHYTTGWQWILRYWFGQKVLGKNRHVPWPVPPHVMIAQPSNIRFDPDDMQNFHTVGSYFQGIGAPVTIGKGTMIAGGAGFITANHSIDDVRGHQEGKPVTIGPESWIAMHAVVLPGVILGPHTVVGAGAIVTKSFPEGYCVLAGNPARKIRDLRDENQHETTQENE